MIVTGAEDVVKLLEHCLEVARAGGMPYVAVAACLGEKQAGGGYAGNSLYEPMAEEICRQMADHLKASNANREPPLPDASLGADYVCYNAMRSALCFDFFTWLIDAEMTRRREGAPYPLKVGFFFGRDGSGWDMSPQRRQMFENVIRPGLAFVGAVEDERAIYGRCKYVYVSDVVRANVLGGEKVPQLRPSAKAINAVETMLNGRRPVTITLREAQDWPHRNSNLDAWLKFALYLDERGQKVIFVRDTAKAHQKIPGAYDVMLSPAASVDIDYRLALYEVAKVNLFVSNGPCVLGLYGTRPCLTFIEPTDDEHPYHPHRPSFWRQHMGIEHGQQFPWARPDQRIVWQRDDYENIVAAWQALGNPGALRAGSDAA